MTTGLSESLEPLKKRRRTRTGLRARVRVLWRRTRSLSIMAPMAPRCSRCEANLDSTEHNAHITGLGALTVERTWVCRRCGFERQTWRTYADEADWGGF